MIVLDKDKRLTIEELLEQEFFNDVKNLREMPKYDTLHQHLKDFITDFIKRSNVYKYEGM